MSRAKLRNACFAGGIMRDLKEERSGAIRHGRLPRQVQGRKIMNPPNLRSLQAERPRE